MVVSGAADLEPSMIQALVYCDAYVPESGESVWSLTSSHFRELFVQGVSADGLTCTPPSTMDARCRPHPIGTFLQTIKLSGAWRGVPRKIYVGAHGWEGSPFLDLYRRLDRDPQWATYALNCGHNIPRLEPEALVEILISHI